MSENTAQLKQAVHLALVGDWDASHKIAQDYSDPMANWIHAVLHKIEGDEWNSKYWYKRTIGLDSGVKQYEDYADAQQELLAIQHSL
ncbi:MAG: hypothetical protein ACKE5M_06125 [Methylophilaceae bacterium]